MTDIVERLREAHPNSAQRAAGSDILAEAANEIERLRAALYQIIDLDHHNQGPESRATLIARASL